MKYESGRTADVVYFSPHADLSLPGYPQVFAAGDIAALTDKNGVKVPGDSLAAIQMGGFIANSIQNERCGSDRPAFGYWDKGSMATFAAAQLIMALGILNVWLLGAHKATAYRGGNAKNMREEFATYGLPYWCASPIRQALSTDLIPK